MIVIHSVSGVEKRNLLKNYYKLSSEEYIFYIYHWRKAGACSVCGENKKIFETQKTKKEVNWEFCMSQMLESHMYKIQNTAVKVCLENWN